MAQMRRARARSGARSLARRLGLTGKRTVALACAAVLAVTAIVGVFVQLATPGVLVEREEGGAVGAKATDSEADSSVKAATTDSEPSAGEPTIVHVDGAVAVPGVYRLEGDDLRIEDAVEAAGGLTADADTSTVNLAAVLEDGTKIHIPVAGEAAPATDADGAASGGASDASSSPSASELVNINSATSEELETLPGIGPSTAQAIIEDREQNGPFASPEDLMRVSGIGEKKYAKLEGYICV
jgi:competence protein ComEA